MNLNKFATWVTTHEGLKEQITIAQVKEVLRLINLYFGGVFYHLVRVWKPSMSEIYKATRKGQKR